MKLPVLISATAVLCTLAGGMYALDRTYARSDKVCQVERRLDRKILSDDARDLQRRQWDILRYHGEDKGRNLREYRELEQQRQMILRELNK
jgi:hypothetical protein